MFDALTSSDAIVNYYPVKKVTTEWQEGGAILLDGEIDGKPFRDHGVIECLSRPAQFAYSYWSDNHGTERTLENHLTIRYRLAPQQHGTQLDLEHSILKSVQMLNVMDNVWDNLLESLGKHVEHHAHTPSTH